MRRNIRLRLTAVVLPIVMGMLVTGLALSQEPQKGAPKPPAYHLKGCALITNRESEAELRDEARAVGGVSMFQDGLRKVLNGLVSYQELMRVAAPDRLFPPLEESM